MGDYNRFLAEIYLDNESDRLSATNQALSSYLIASEIAKTHIIPSDPIRLALALNFSIFYYEILSQPSRAVQLAKNAYDEAAAELTNTNDEAFKDRTLVMMLLKDYLANWMSEMNDPAHDDNNSTY